MAHWTTFVPTLALCMMRPLGVFILLPLFTSRSLGGSLVRNALVLLIALPLLPAYLGAPVLASAGSGPDLVLLYAREVVIGVLIGFSAALPFWAIDIAGYVIDTMRGTSIASAINPALGEQSSIFGILFSQILSVIFLASGGFNTLLTAIYDSYLALPPRVGLAIEPGLMRFVSGEWRMMMDLSIAFALPSIVGMVLVDVAFGFINRAAEQLNVFFIAMPVKSGVALFVIAIGVGYALDGFNARFSGFNAVSAQLTGFLQ
ncbi:type III secretion system export apparatus subunit SctT [Burkholderia sp. WSM2232]|uniref:type III secretion system export apparatus subunit SctT n=1 Tax=Burkholderia sp. WSM2232 TaxID=944436 RepID=UPI000418E028|nr:type III secretion system export apparatus subunit SctT [Burkholderia sp. WSM2232]